MRAPLRWYRVELLHLLWCRQVDLRLRAAAAESPEAWGAEFKTLIREVRTWPHEQMLPPAGPDDGETE